MMETKQNPNPNGCLARALPNEPFATFLARDPDAPAAFKAWAISRCERLGLTRDDPEVDWAIQCIAGFTDWREKNDGKWRAPAAGEVPSEEMTSLAGKALNDDPMNDPALFLRINDELEKLGTGTFTGKGIDDLKTAVRAVMLPYFKERESMAGALLRLDPKAGQGGAD
jgi:hypothetical protein